MGSDALDPTAATLDPYSDDGRGGEERGAPRLPVLEILFHSDLARVGGRTAPTLLISGLPLTVGREAPLFRAEVGAAAPLADPCISREQLSVSWSPRERMFRVAAAGGARRPLELVTTGGEVLAGPEVAPGTLLAIGDRCLLLLALSDAEPDQGGELIGASPAMRALRDRIRGVAEADGTVLVHGESGSGKELVARAVHRASRRGRGPLVVVNCAAIPENLLESELFGHVRGAFTGATTSKDGFFKAAHGGTLFLDEIGELAAPLQGKLLRALEARSILPVGALREETVDARVIAATNRDLGAEVAAGRFREDLYYRLTALTVAVPPLRERREDVPRLFVHFLRKETDQHPELGRLWRAADQQPPPLPLSLFRQLVAYEWPGNVRHLRNVVEKIAVDNLHRPGFKLPAEVEATLSAPPERPAAAAGRGETTAAPLPAAPLREAIPSSASDLSGARTGIDEARLLALLAEHDYVQRRVAQALGVSHTTVDRLMRELGLRRPADLGREELERLARETGNDLAEMARRLKVSRRGLKLRLGVLGLDAD
jgi:two-component system nitrogen regulation response regulator GlnG